MYTCVCGMSVYVFCVYLYICIHVLSQVRNTIPVLYGMILHMYTCTCVYVYMCLWCDRISVYMYICIRVCVYMYMCMYICFYGVIVYIYICICVPYIYIYVHVYMYICVYGVVVYMYICMYVYIQICIYVYMYIGTESSLEYYPRLLWRSHLWRDRIYVYM